MDGKVKFIAGALVLLAAVGSGVALIQTHSNENPVGQGGRDERVEWTDMAGRTIRLPSNIERVVPLGGAMRFMVYLDSLELVAGIENVERKWRSPGRLYGLAVTEKTLGMTVIGEGGPGRLPDFEKLLAVRPDVIVAMGIDAAQVAIIQEKTGIPVFTLSYGRPGTLDLDTTREAVKRLGCLLGRTKRADELRASIDELTADLAERTSGIPAAQRVAAYAGAISFKGTQGITSTNSDYAPLTWAGGRNVAADLPHAGHCFIDREKIVDWDPETIFVDAGGLAPLAEDCRENPGFYAELTAVQKGRVYLVLPYNYYHTNVEIALDDAFLMGKVLYPDRFEDVDPASKADEIFTAFIGRPAYAELAGEYHGFQQLLIDADGNVKAGAEAR